MLFSHLRHVPLFATPWTAACQASLTFTISQSLLKLTSIESGMPSNIVSFFFFFLQFLFYVLGFGLETCGILAPHPGIKPAPPELKDEVLTTGRSGKFQNTLP